MDMGQTNRMFKTKDGVNKALFKKAKKGVNRAIKKQKQELNDRVDALVNNMKTTHGTIDKTRHTTMNEYKNIMDSIKQIQQTKKPIPSKTKYNFIDAESLYHALSTYFQSKNIKPDPRIYEDSS